MTPRENLLCALHHQPHDWTPCFLSDVAIAGFGALPGPSIEKGGMRGGPDGFGVNWVTPSSGGGASIPEPGKFLLSDITRWKTDVHIPDVKSFDWQADADLYLGNVDRTQQVVDFGMGNGIFERLAALMGFENALMALYTDPEAVNDFFTALTEYKMKMVDEIVKAYHPDTITNYDDIAMERGPFMSPDTYRTLIKPHHKRLNDHIRSRGVLPIQHTCGKCDMLVEDFIETGAQAWTSVQPTNDICGILDRYGDRFTIIGGMDTNGAAAITADIPLLAEEVHRCIDTYGKYNSYIFFGFVLVNSLDPAEIGAKIGPMIGECIQYSHRVAGK